MSSCRRSGIRAVPPPPLVQADRATSRGGPLAAARSPSPPPDHGGPWSRLAPGSAPLHRNRRVRRRVAAAPSPSSSAGVGVRMSPSVSCLRCLASASVVRPCLVLLSCVFRPVSPRWRGAVFVPFFLVFVVVRVVPRAAPDGRFRSLFLERTRALKGRVPSVDSSGLIRTPPRGCCRQTECSVPRISFHVKHRPSIPAFRDRRSAGDLPLLSPAAAAAPEVGRAGRRARFHWVCSRGLISYGDRRSGCARTEIEVIQAAT